MQFRLLIVIPQPFNDVLITIVAYNFDDATSVLALYLLVLTSCQATVSVFNTFCMFFCSITINL